MEHTWTAFLLLRSQHSEAPAQHLKAGEACTLLSRLTVLRDASLGSEQIHFLKHSEEAWKP